MLDQIVSVVRNIDIKWLCKTTCRGSPGVARFLIRLLSTRYNFCRLLVAKWQQLMGKRLRSAVDNLNALVEAIGWARLEVGGFIVITLLYRGSGDCG